MAITYNTSIVRNGLVLHLDAANKKSYPGSGTTWTDLSGNGNHGTLTNGPTFDSGNNGSIVFDGIDDYVNCATGVQLSNDFTITVWHKNVNTGFLVDQGNIGTDPTGCLEYTNRGLTLAFNNSETVTATGSFSNTSSWNQATCSFASGSANFYINGVFDSTKTTTTASFSPNGNILKIGRRAFSTSSILSGSISIVKIYNRVLTAAEIQQNFNALRGRYGI
jgi:hypothetical protein